MFNEFSVALMKKYGWKEGEGLGKTNQGISKPVRANLKFNNLGIGYQEVASDQDSKWANMYSSALSRLSVDNGCDVTVAKDVTEDNLNRLGYTSLSRGFRKSDIFIKDGLEINVSKEKSKKRKRNEDNGEQVIEEKQSKKEKKKKTIIVCEENSLNEEVSESTSNNSDKISKKKRKLDKSIPKEETIESSNKLPEDVIDTCTAKDKKSRKKERRLKKMADETAEKNITLGNDQNSSFSEVIQIESTENLKKKKSKKSKAELIDTENLILPNSSFMTCHPSARFGLGMSGKLARAQRLYDSEKLAIEMKDSISLKAI